MPLFNINPIYARSVGEAVAAFKFAGPWEIMPVEPGSTDQQLWVHDETDAARLRFAVRWSALTPCGASK